jgi:hypothetical protein
MSLAARHCSFCLLMSDPSSKLGSDYTIYGGELRLQSL